MSVPWGAAPVHPPRYAGIVSRFVRTGATGARHPALMRAVRGCGLAAALLVPSGLVAIAAAQEPGPTPAAAAFADALARTGWGGASIANGAGLAVRSVPLYSQGMLDAVTARSARWRGSRSRSPGSSWPARCPRGRTRSG